jgi:hypothetical protein
MLSESSKRRTLIMRNLLSWCMIYKVRALGREILLDDEVLMLQRQSQLPPPPPFFFLCSALEASLTLLETLHRVGCFDNR